LSEEHKAFPYIDDHTNQSVHVLIRFTILLLLAIQFAAAANGRNKKTMVTKSLESRKSEKLAALKSTAMSKNAKMEEHSKKVPKPIVPKKASSSALNKAERDEERANKSLLHGADFEGSLYDDEEGGFRGADAFHSSPQRKTGKEAERQRQVVELEAEHESAKAKIEKLRQEFGI